jgi:PilZ domain-containing protein
MENRRRMARQSAGWGGFCHIEGESASGWRDCRVMDVSLLGIGIRMQYARPSDLVGRRVSIEAPAVGESINIRFEGVVKHVSRTPLHWVRVGIEFNHLSTSERAILEVLSHTNTDRELTLA